MNSEYAAMGNWSSPRKHGVDGMSCFQPAAGIRTILRDCVGLASIIFAGGGGCDVGRLEVRNGTRMRRISTDKTKESEEEQLPALTLVLSDPRQSVSSVFIRVPFRTTDDPMRTKDTTA